MTPSAIIQLHSSVSPLEQVVQTVLYNEMAQALHHGKFHRPEV
ncbi:hypothetical protein DSOL_3983 [Desulfosporosinus metallidurans]|uniref:Uncharacterized protein n=1 Tax=Desulfosporosinus metallidurans TaxID=1888891 RepID=A0A1Q8QMP2_9FIRM|nr:hypothetical protein DSOL_3983 [Desulfosporosinus metallidurans]